MYMHRLYRGLHSYGLCSYGLCSYGLHGYGLYSYGLYSYIVMAYIVMALPPCPGDDDAADRRRCVGGADTGDGYDPLLWPYIAMALHSYGPT